jgi:hypothetical protein
MESPGEQTLVALDEESLVTRGKVAKGFSMV